MGLVLLPFNVPSLCIEVSARKESLEIRGLLQRREAPHRRKQSATEELPYGKPEFLDSFAGENFFCYLFFAVKEKYKRFV
jgi:hypothetical protein